LFKVCKTQEEEAIAFAIIKKNREVRGFPLRMTWEQIEETIKVIKADFFLLYNDSKETIASAMVFHINSKVVQVVYWGDLPEFSHLKTMNFLSYKIFEYYQDSTVEIIDIGPSTEDSIPNYGLCEFKESIGCDITTKLIVSKTV
jgi:lipid II:glycine glycyltransferase (peptidoglycan interpeptide bridge formation enzyme)